MENESTNEFFDHLRKYAVGSINQVGPYKVIRQVAKGGQGVVYHGIDSRDDSPVALKRCDQYDGKSVSKLVRGTELMSLLDHPYILSLKEILETEEALWIITPWVEGVSINKWVTEFSTNDDETITLFLQICDAVSHAHARGVIHRDLRPANILVTPSSKPCVLDFGIAKQSVLAHSTHVATQSELSGDILFLAPEMLRQSAPASDIRQDIYSLGVLLYTMLTESHPLDDLPMGECVERVLSGQLFDANIEKQLEGSIGSIIRKATSSDLNARYRTVQEFADDLIADMNGYPVTAKVHTQRYLIGRFARRNRMPLVAGALIVIILFASTVAVTSVIARGNNVRDANTQTMGMLQKILRSLAPTEGLGPTADGLSVLKFASEQLGEYSDGKSREENIAYADVHAALASSYLSYRRGDLGIPHGSKALDIYLELLGRDHPKTQETGSVLVNLYIESNKVDSAEKYMDMLIDDLDVSQIENPTYLFLMGMMRAKRQSEDALLYYEKYIDMMSDAPLKLANAYETRGKYLNQAGRLNDALNDAEQAYQIYNETLGPDDARTLSAQLLMAKSLQLVGRYQEERQLIVNIMPAVERAFGMNDPRTFRGWAHFVIAETEIGDSEIAFERAQRLLDQSISVYPEDHWHITQCKFLVSHTLLNLGRSQEVIDLLQPRMHTIELHNGQRLTVKYQSRLWITRAWNNLGEFEEAKRVIKPAYEELAVGLGSEHLQVLECSFQLLRANHGLNNELLVHEEAEQLLEQVARVSGPHYSLRRRIQQFVDSL